MQILINILGFKIGWLSSVVGAATQMPWLGPVMLLVVLAVHLRQAERPDLEIGLVIACGVIGAWFDSILAATGWEGQLHSHLRGAIHAGNPFSSVEKALEEGLRHADAPTWTARARDLWRRVRSAAGRAETES